MIPTSIDGTDITGATIDGTDVQEITVDGDTVFTASQLFDFEDGTDQGLTLTNLNGGATFTVGSEPNTPSGTFSANNIDPNGTSAQAIIELGISGVPFFVKYDVFMENSSDKFQGVGVSGDAVAAPINEGFAFFPSSGEDFFQVFDGGSTITDISINQPLNDLYTITFDVDNSFNYNVSVERSGSVVVSDSGTFSSSNFNDVHITSRHGGGNVGKNLFDNIEIA